MRVLITLLFLIAVFTVHAQTTFYSQINHAGYSTTLKKLSDGNLLSANSDNYTVEVIKTDTNGLFIWQSTLPAPWTEVIEVEEAADGGIFVLMYGPYQQNRCAYVLRLKSNGLLDWHQGYHHLSNDYFLDIQAMPDTGFMVIGNGCSAAGAQLVRCKKTGSIAWDKTYIDANGKYFGFTQFVLVNNGTELLFSGYTVAPAVDEDLLVAKMDTAGNLLWLKEYPLAGSFDVPMAITETPTGFAVAFFYQYPLPNSTYYRSGLAGFDASGNMQWLARYYFPTSSMPKCLGVLPDSSLTFGGTILYAQDSTKFRALLVHTSPMGQQLWSYSFSDSVYSNGSSQAVEALVISGTDAYLTGGGYMMYLAKTNSSGYGMCLPVYGGPQTVYLPVPAAVSRSLYSYTGAWTAFPATATPTSAITMQGYTSCTNIITQSAEIVSADQWTVSSDPFSDGWIVTSPASSTTEKVVVQVYDAMGRIVLHTTFSGGNGTYRLERNGLAAGVYFYSISGENTNLGSGKILAR